VATGQAGTNAHLLNGRGDFTMVGVGADAVRFQAPFTDDQEIKALVAPYRGATGIPILRMRAQGVDLIDRDACTRAPQPEVRALPQRPALPAPPDQSERVGEAVRALRPHWPTLRESWLAEEWGIKTKLVRLAYGDAHRYEGAFAGWIEAAVAELEKDGNGNGNGGTPPTPHRRRKAGVLAQIAALQEVADAAHVL